VNSESKLRSVGIIGDSPAMQLLAGQIETAARCDLTAVVTGESGTGKELVARALHQQSARAGMPFISVNCGAITDVRVLFVPTRLSPFIAHASIRSAL